MSFLSPARGVSVLSAYLIDAMATAAVGPSADRWTYRQADTFLLSVGINLNEEVYCKKKWEKKRS